MLNGFISEAKRDASRTAVRGGLYVYAGIFAAFASLFVAVAIVFSLLPLIGPGLAILCGGVFLMCLAGLFFIVAEMRGNSSAHGARKGHAQAQSLSGKQGAKQDAKAGGLDYTQLLTQGLAGGMLEKQMRDHPIRMVSAAVAAGAVMGLMEAMEDDK